MRILLLHIRLFLQAVDGPNVVQRLRNVAGSTADRAAVGNLGCQHVFLYVTGKEEQDRQKNNQNNRKSAVCHPDGNKNT